MKYTFTKVTREDRAMAIAYDTGLIKEPVPVTHFPIVKEWTHRREDAG